MRKKKLEAKKPISQKLNKSAASEQEELQI
jgi:hypothetical protein